MKNHTSPTQPRTLTGSQAVIQSLLAENVDTIFGYPGGAIMPIYDALYDFRSKINHILARHEQGAIHGAQGYARASGKVGVCFATSGPGATNLITGLADAMIDSTPLVCFSGQVNSPLLGTDAFQESDVIGLSMPVTKWNYQIKEASEIPEMVAKAFFIANSGRPGPVLLDVTKDAQVSLLEFLYKPCTKIRSYLPEQPIEKQSIVDAAELINKAERPFLLVGQGVILSKAEEELLKFIEKTGIPAAWTLLGLSAVPTDHPLNVGMLGMHGNYAPNKLTNECDVLIAVGMRFDDRVTGNVATYAKQAKVIHIEIDPSEIDKIIPSDVAVCGDARKALRLLNRVVEKRTHQAWVDRFNDLYKQEYEVVIDKAIAPKKNGITMGEVVDTVSTLTNNEAVMVTDVGQQQMMAARYFRFTKTRSVVTSGGLGTMGFGLPAAMGAAMGAPERDVVLFVGDGGFQMTIQELGTIAQLKIPVKVVILNNEFLGMVRQWQELFFERRYSFTEMSNPDFKAIAEGYGIKANSVSGRESLDGILKEMVEHDGPYVLEVKVEKEENVFPMVPTGATVSDVMLSPDNL